MIKIVVLGPAATAGSKRAFPFQRQNGSLGVRVTHDNKRLSTFTAEIRAAAASQVNGSPMEGSVCFGMAIVRLRPKSHFGTGKNKNRLKESAPVFPATRPDNTKVRRAVEDALTGIAWKDDSQIVFGLDTKIYGWPERVEIFVSSRAEEVSLAVAEVIATAGK